MMTATEMTPRAWVGCLGCYNAGHLVGQWLDADQLEEPDYLAAICAHPEHEELWCMDTENLGIGECSPAEAAERARAVVTALEQAEEVGCPAAVALEYLEDTNSEPDAWPDIRDAYAGSADSEADYVLEYLEQYGIDLPSWLCVDYARSFEELTSGMPRYRHEGAWELFYE
jgi:antirestriction protein